MLREVRRGGIFALSAAALYSLSIPVSKVLLTQVTPMMMAALMYFGAASGLLLCRGVGTACGHPPDAALHLTRKELPYAAGMVVLDIAAPILLMFGVLRTSSANASLFSSFETAVTAPIALLLFHERISGRLWTAIGLTTAASILLSFEGTDSLAFSSGSLLVLGAYLCWGMENNCTRCLSRKSAVEVVIVKGCGSGLGSLLLALLTGEWFPPLVWAAAAMALGFISYGLSSSLYIRAQKVLGAARTSAFYTAAPFFGAGYSLLLLGERPAPKFYLALVILAAAAVLLARDSAALGASEKKDA